MAKKILFESAVHQFLGAGSRAQARLRPGSPRDAAALAEWIRGLQIENLGSGQLRVTWAQPSTGEHVVEFKAAKFYTRGDTEIHGRDQHDKGLVAMDDRVMAANCRVFDGAFLATVAAAGLFDPVTFAKGFPAPAEPAKATPDGAATADALRKAAEEHFHDEWAASEDVSRINVRQRNEACTAPEMRFIRQALGDLRGKTLLDVGCGLGEASVYFALEGARVTATDVSPGMCDTTRRLAAAQGTQLETHVSAAEDLRLGDRQFDIIYVGNTLHHVDLATTMDRLLPHLRDDGVFVSWDPVAYNPLINIYRAVATEVRTPDEHPLRLRDIRAITSRFETAEKRWFWFSTLSIFVCMVVVQFRNPNKVRFWKKVIDEADRWRWLYQPLEKLDTFALAWLPFLRPLCWNIAIVGRRPVRHSPSPHA
jgi:2-polyprenyl-3-methyl-5-hydroxy-6-metoxy-1,4-benzoquinol methylase